jgi:hypothetical protein
VADYIIEKVGDLLKVPEDKIDLCLSELKEALATVRGIQGVADLCSEMTTGEKPEETIIPLQRFVWHDDGKKNVNINIHIVPET